LAHLVTVVLIFDPSSWSSGGGTTVVDEVMWVMDGHKNCQEYPNVLSCAQTGYQR